jgi:hypothetical protein
MLFFEKSLKKGGKNTLLPYIVPYKRDHFEILVQA